MLPTLPIIEGGKRDQPAWREYLKWVYGDDVPGGASVDLNTFSWFYHQAPLGETVTPADRGSWNFLEGAIPVNSAWTCSLPFLPQCWFSSYGFFVYREEPAPSLEAWKELDRVEVLRVKFEEKGAAWFYKAVGSGVFLNLRALPAPGQTKIVLGQLPDLGAYDQQVYQYMLSQDCNLLVSAQRFRDGKVEIVVRGGGPTEDMNSPCPLSPPCYSTGLFSSAPCVCSEAPPLVLLNCRTKVARILETEKPLDVVDFYVRFIFFVLSIGCILAVVVVALWLQSKGR